MNFFAEQMNRIFENSPLHRAKSESSKGLYVKINDKHFANVEFTESQKGTGFDQISIKVINKIYGLVDCAVFDFESFIGNIYIKYSPTKQSFVWFYKNHNESCSCLKDGEYRKLYHLIFGYFSMFV